MFRLVSIFTIIVLSHAIHAQVYQGLVIPDKKGRFPASSEITQASGLALDNNGISLWTHNDQGNPITKVYKILTSAGESDITIEKEVNILNALNLDWEDMAKDNSGNIYLCQVGKNCNANSDPLECPGRYIFKVHKLSFSVLNHPDSSSISPETFYFRYPLTGYDVNNCGPNDTVFVNCEAAIWSNGALYFFSKNIWSKPTNNCGGWQEGYTHMFKLTLTGGSSMENPLIAEYKGNVNLKLSGSELPSKYQVTAAAISPDQTIVALTTYGRIWQFRNFSGDLFFEGNRIFNDFSTNGTDTITRGYEGVEFVNNHYVKLCVDGVNGRLSGIDLDSIALWVRNTNNAGAGSLRNVLLSVTEGDTAKFIPGIINDTIALSSPLTFSRNVNLIQQDNQPVYLSASTNAILVPAGKNVSLKNIDIIANSSLNPGIINYGSLSLDNLNLYNTGSTGISVQNHGLLFLKNECRIYTD